MAERAEHPMLELDLVVRLRRFDLQVRVTARGRALAVLGPSGAGKTSLLEAICGLQPGATGCIRVGGRALLDAATAVRLPPERRRIGYVPQDALLFPHLNAGDNIRFGLRGRPQGSRRFDEVVSLAEVGPVLAQYPATLSGGERQRVALARALAPSPDLLVLDEPLAALDVELKQRVLPYLLRVRDEGRTPLVYVTHHWGEARALAEEALVLREGKVAAFGSATEILAPSALAGLGPLPDAENVVHGVLEASGAMVLLRRPGGSAVCVPARLDEAGSAAAFSVPAEDILVSIHPLTGVSARNVFEGQVLDATPVGGDALVRVAGSGSEWLAKLTWTASKELALEPGRRVYLAIKSHSFRRLK